MRWLAHDRHRYYATTVMPLVPLVIIVALLIPLGEEGPRTPLLVVMVFWVLWCVSHVVVTYAVFGRRTPERHTELIRSSGHTRRSVWRFLLGLDEGAVSFGVQMSLLMLVLMVVVLVTPTLRGDMPVVAMAALTVASCWGLTIVSYAVEYARADHRRQGLEFPGGPIRRGSATTCTTRSPCRRRSPPPTSPCSPPRCGG